jgi:hypothetical protein
MRSSKPGKITLPRERWKRLGENAKTLWDSFSDEDKYLEEMYSIHRELRFRPKNNKFSHETVTNECSDLACVNFGRILAFSCRPSSFETSCSIGSFGHH